MVFPKDLSESQQSLVSRDQLARSQPNLSAIRPQVYPAGPTTFPQDAIPPRPIEAPSAPVPMAMEYRKAASLPNFEPPRGWHPEKLDPKEVELREALKKPKSEDDEGQKEKKSLLHPTYEFTDETTIHGAKHVGQRGTWWPLKVFWVLVFAGCVFGCFFLVIRTILQYLGYDVKTTIQYKQATTTEDSTIPLPAITFCSNNHYFRSSVGAAPQLLSLAELNRGDNNTAAAQQICNVPTAALLNSRVQQSPWEAIGIMPTEKLYNHDSFRSIVECQWQREIVVNCTSLFLNHMTDIGLCFTFNPSTQLLDSYEPLETTWSPFKATSYGTSKEEYASRPPFRVTNSGYRNGIQFILNANSGEYCNLAQQKSVGFVALVHDPDVTPILSMERLVDLTPGYAANIAVSIYNLVKDTEQYGKCKSQLSLEMYPNMTAYTNKQACYSNCYTKKFIDECGCIPYFAAPWAFRLYPKLHTCGIQDPQENVCQMTVIRTVKNEGLAGFCENNPPKSVCPIPCEQMTYVTDMTFSFYPAINTLQVLNDRFHTHATLDEFRKDYVSVQFFVDDMEYQVVEESIAIEWIDLLNALGGAIGFFLGSSLVSVFEVIFWVIKQSKVIYKDRQMKQKHKRYATDNQRYPINNGKQPLSIISGSKAPITRFY